MTLGAKNGLLKATANNKALPANGALPRFEVASLGTGTLLGVEVQSNATYIAEMRADGSMYGELPNSGVIMAKDGIATFRAAGAGHLLPDGGS